MDISLSESFKALPFILETTKEHIKFKVDPSKVMRIALQVIALIAIAGITYACPPLSLVISVVSFLAFHPFLKYTVLKINTSLTGYPTYAEAREKLTPALRMLYSFSRFRLVSDISRMAALCLCFQPAAIPLLIANGIIMAIDGSYVMKIQKKLNAHIMHLWTDDEQMLYNEGILISDAYPAVSKEERQILCASEKQTRHTKEKYQENQIRWVSAAWARMLASKVFDVDDSINYEIYNPLTQLSIVYELEDKSIFTKENCPPSQKNRFEHLQKARHDYRQLSYSQKSALKNYIIDEKARSDTGLLDLYRQIGQLADPVLRAGTVLQKGIHIGSEKHYFWSFRLVSFLRMQKEYCFEGIPV